MELNNDFKSINIDKFIDNFKQTYPHYLEMSQAKADINEVQSKGDIELKDRAKEPNADGRRRGSVIDSSAAEDLNNKMEDYIVIKPPNASSELNNYIKYGF
jgi:hypothetical protein